jgi:peptide/nickel transport system substrate-binding protein
MVRLALLCLAVLIGGCRPETGADLVFAVATAPRLLDPRLAADAASERVNDLLYASLVTLDDQGRPRPGMADWTRVDGQTYRFTLRPDRARFSDGALPGADDVVATYRSVLDPSMGSPHASAVRHVQAVEALDDERVEFRLGRPDPQFPSRLGVGILPAESARLREPVTHPVGSGAFRFVTRLHDGGVVLERRGDGQRVRIQPTPDPTMRALKLVRGEAQLLQNNLPAELYGYLAGVSDIDVTQADGITFAYLGFNLADPVLSQIAVRRAIAHAIDREAIIRYLFDGRARPAGGVLRPTHWAGAPQLGGFAYDPERARELLAGAGHDVDRPLTLVYKTSTDPFRLRIAHVFQQQLAAVGIDLVIRSYDWGTFFGDIKAGRFQLYSLAWVGVNTPDILRYAFHSASTPPQGANRGGYASALVDALIEQAERLPPHSAAPLLREAQAHIHDDLVYVPLWYEANVAATRGVRGFTPAFDGSYRSLTQAAIARDVP